MTERELNNRAGTGSNRQTTTNVGTGPSGRSQQSGNGNESLTDQAKHTASNAADQAKDAVSNVADQAQSQVQSQIAAQKEKAGNALDSVAQALRQTGDQLRSNDQGMLGDYANKAAHQVNELADYVQSHDLNDLMYEAERFARRQPALFLGGAFALGVLASRFFKSSSEHQRSRSYNSYGGPRSYPARSSRYGRGPMMAQRRPMPDYRYEESYQQRAPMNRTPMNRTPNSQTMNAGSYNRQGLENHQDQLRRDSTGTPTRTSSATPDLNRNREDR